MCVYLFVFMYEYTQKHARTHTHTHTHSTTAATGKPDPFCCCLNLMPIPALGGEGGWGWSHFGGRRCVGLTVRTSAGSGLLTSLGAMWLRLLLLMPLPHIQWCVRRHRWAYSIPTRKW